MPKDLYWNSTREAFVGATGDAARNIAVGRQYLVDILNDPLYRYLARMVVVLGFGRMVSLLVFWKDTLHANRESML